MAWLMEDCLRRVGSARTLRAHLQTEAIWSEVDQTNS